MTAAPDALPLRRDRAFLFRRLGGGAACLAAAVYQAYHNELVWTVVWAAAGGAMLYVALTTGSAACPAQGCGARLLAAVSGEPYVRCPGCGAYYASKEGRLWPMPEDALASYPVFSVFLPGAEDERLNPPGIGLPTAPALAGGDRSYDFAWPQACCVCGAQPAGGESLGMTAVLKYARAGGLVDERVTLSVAGIPHCAEHRLGAALAIQDGRAVLKFRSYAFRNSFRKLNKLTG